MNSALLNPTLLNTLIASCCSLIIRQNATFQVYWPGEKQNSKIIKITEDAFLNSQPTFGCTSSLVQKSHQLVDTTFQAKFQDIMTP